jgi:hypothetical protein
MMGDAENPDQVMQLIEAVHNGIAAFARESYAIDGRGLILIAVPQVTRRTSTLISTEMVYHPLSAVERLATDIGASAGGDGGALIRMIHAYDPATQALVSVRIQGQRPITLKKNFAGPFVVDESERIH